MSKRILLRADDLGYSEGVNYGIAKTVRDGIIRSVGLMPNMPSAAHGVELLAGLDVCLGQHTNICVGRPLTDPSLIPSLCQKDGTFKPSKAYRAAQEDFVALDEVILEIEAQYRRFVQLTGRQPAYFEGHAVMSRNLYQGLEIVARRHGLDYLGISFGGEAVPFRTTPLTFVMDSMLPDYDPFATLQRAAALDCGPNGCAMVIFHPGYLDDFILRTSSLTLPRVREAAVSCDPATKAWLKENDIQIITYDELP